MDAKTDDRRGQVPVHGRHPRTPQSRLVAGPPRYRRAPYGPPFRRSDGRGVRLRQGIQEPRPQCRDQGPACPDDGLRRTGGRPTSATTADCSSAWRGTAPAPIASPTAAAAPVPVSSASRRSTAGLTTPTSTRRAACCGRSSRSTATRFPGPTSSFSPATSRWSRWASRPSVSPAAAPMSGSRKSSTGVPKARGSATSATAANASSPNRSARCRWA